MTFHKLLLIFLSFVFFTLLFQCNVETNNNKFISCDFTSTSQIEVPTTTSVTYKIHDYLDKDGIFAAYHYPSHSIDFINLESGAFMKKLSLESEGPNFTSQVLSLYIHNMDSIFLLTLNQIIGMNDKGQKWLEMKINQNSSDISGFDINSQRIWCNAEHNQPIYYSKKHNSIYVGIKTNDTEISMKNYELPIAGRITLDSMAFEFLPIFYPNTFREGYYGVLDNPHLVFFDDFTIAAFSAFYDLYHFDHSKNLGLAFGMTSEFIKEETEMMKAANPQAAYQDFEQMQEYIKINPRTAKLRIHRNSMTLYNLYYAPKNLDRPNYRAISTFQISEDGTTSTKINEIVVDHDDYMTKIYFPTNKGLGLIDKSSTNDILLLKFMNCEN